MQTSFRAWILLFLMITFAAMGWALRPTMVLAEQRPKVELEQMVPRQFGVWRELQNISGQIVNPQTQEKLDSIYNQILTRSYVNTEGHRVMLSIAYGKDQRAYMAVHYPEVCYPAQGFSVSSNKVATLQLAKMPTKVRQLEAALGKQRPEPITYWTTIGEYHSLGGFSKRLLELRYGLSGVIPDGLIFRVSSIGADSATQFHRQEMFLDALLNAVSPDARAVLAGVSSD